MLLSFGVSWGSVALADGVRETNYQQGRLETTHTLIGSLRPEHSLDVRSRDGVIRAVGGSDVAEGNPLSIVKETDGRRAIVLHFDKAACAVGIQVSIKWGQPSNSVPIDFEFFDRDGRTIGVQHQWPAIGTTRQAYQSESVSYAFSAVRVSSPTEWLERISGVWMMPCSVAVS